MANYPLIFGIALVLNVALSVRSSDLYRRWTQQVGGRGDEGVSEDVKKKHTSLLRRYLCVYLLAAASDWLQGPYVYALYSDYHFSQHEIAQLFVAGFGSSMIFGSFVGGMADVGGRRAFVILFSVVYAASCLTKHFNNYGILMIGRLLGGVATSLLFSVFDAWLIRSHADADLPKSFLSKSFSWAAYGNSVAAILAGLIANKIANASTMKPIAQGSNIYRGGFLNPFDLALMALVACGALAYSLWDENYGEQPDTDTSSKTDRPAKWYDSMRNAFNATVRNKDVLLCGIISSLFEGSMYIFVFMWTPLLKNFLTGSETLPFGLIFSTFMVSCMAGSSIFSSVVEKQPVEKLGVIVFIVGSFAMGLVALGINQTTSFLGMNIFEICVGMYFPIMGTMKGSIVPEDKRAAIYNLYRVPLNFIVLFSLLTDLTPTFSFGLNATMLATAAVLQTILNKRRLENGSVVPKNSDIESNNDVEYAALTNEGSGSKSED